MNAWISRIKLTDNLLAAPIADIRVFPVPSQNDVFIELKVETAGVYQASLTNMLGQSLKTNKQITLGTGIHKLRIDGIGLAAGTYIIQIQKDGKPFYHQKILLQ
jgi:hypothetical protein